MKYFSKINKILFFHTIIFSLNFHCQEIRKNFLILIYKHINNILFNFFLLISMDLNIAIYQNVLY